jgi:oxidoreductase AflX
MASKPPTYALLGATGQVGQSLLTILYDSPSQPTIHALVRSSAKLEQLNPEATASSRLKTFTSASVDADIPTLAACISGTRAVFLAVALTQNDPACRIAQDTAEAVIAAITLLKQQARPVPGKLVMLSSAETEMRLCGDIPWLIRHILFAANSYIYRDLMAAEQYLRSQADLVSTTFMKPGGLSHDRQTTHELNTERQQTFISFLDLAAGMVEVAESEDGTWDMKSVSVLASGQAKPAYENAPKLLQGLILHFFPWLASWIL